MRSGTFALIAAISSLIFACTVSAAVSIAMSSRKDLSRADNSNAPLASVLGLMTTRDLTTYTKLFELTCSLLPKPDLLIYVRGDVPTLIRHIQKRGREYESSIRLDYLTNLNNRYETWAASYEGKMLVVDTEELDFVENREDLGLIINKIDAEFNSLFVNHE